VDKEHLIAVRERRLYDATEPARDARGHPQCDRRGAKVKVVDDKSGEDLTLPRC